ncbi:MAG: oligosaccharide flippase family protein [Candidatus Omnitrophota bacterium]
MGSKDRFLANSALVFCGTILVSVSNLLYQMLTVRKLPVAAYGAFNSLLSIVLMLSYPISALTTMIAKFSAAYYSRGERVKAHRFVLIIIRHMFFAGILFLVLYMLGAFHFMKYLRLDSVMPVYMTAFMLFLMVITAPILGALQGFERFTAYSVSNVGGAVCKLGMLALFLMLGWGLFGVLAAYLLSQVIVVAIGGYCVKEVFQKEDSSGSIDIKEKYRFVVPTLVTLGCFGLLTNMDVVLVKHFFESTVAGSYSVAQMVGKIALFIPNAIAVVMLPHAAGLHAQQKDSRGLLRKSLAYTAFLSCGFVVFYNVFPGLVLTVLCGTSGADIIFLGRLFSLCMTFFSLIMVLAIYQLSVSRFKFLKSFVIFTVIQVVAIAFFHRSLPQVLGIILLNSIILFAVNMWYAFKE